MYRWIDRIPGMASEAPRRNVLAVLTYLMGALLGIGILAEFGMV